MKDMLAGLSWDGVVVLLLSLALLTSLLGGLRLVCRAVAIQSRFAMCSPVTDGAARSQLDALLATTSIARPVLLCTSKRCREPIACGLVRWRIVLPEGIDGKLRDDELRALLAHELAHLVRGDTVWLWIGQVLCACFGFQPLNFWARQQWQRAAEIRCDDWALARGVSGFSLARCLTEVAQWRLNRPNRAIALAAGGSANQLAARVQRLLDPSHDPGPSGRRVSRFTFVLIAAGAACLLSLWGPRTIVPAGQPDTEALNVDPLNTEGIEPPATGDSDREQRPIRETRSPRDLRHRRDVGPDDAPIRPPIDGPIVLRDEFRAPAEQIEPPQAIEQSLAKLERELEALDRELQGLDLQLLGADVPQELRDAAGRLREKRQLLEMGRKQLKRLQVEFAGRPGDREQSSHGRPNPENSANVEPSALQEGRP